MNEKEDNFASILRELEESKTRFTQRDMDELKAALEEETGVKIKSELDKIMDRYYEEDEEFLDEDFEDDFLDDDFNDDED